MGLFTIPPSGTAMIRYSGDRPRVLFSQGAWTLPGLHRVEFLSIAVVPLVLELRGEQAVICQDDALINAEATFMLRVQPTEENVLAVATMIGCETASDPEQVRALFRPKCEEAVRAVARKFGRKDLLDKQEEIRMHVFEFIGMDLGGFSLDDISLNFTLPG